MSYVLTPLAKADIFDIWSYIADDNEDAADRVEQAIYDEGNVIIWMHTCPCIATF
jgi:plasmid stabilization system protein ParE